MSSVYKINQYVPTSVQSAVTASYADGLFTIWTSYMDQSTYGRLRIYGAVNDYVDIFVSGSTDDGTLYIRTADNGNEPIKFQTWDNNSSLAPVDRVTIGNTNTTFGTTLMTVHGNVSGSGFYSSATSGIGFFGTASYAMNGGTNGYLTQSITQSNYYGAVPIGTIVSSVQTGSNPPSGFLLCDGSYVLVGNYPELAGIIFQSGSTNSSFGKRYSSLSPLTQADAGTFFQLPDLRGQFIRGHNTGLGNSQGYSSSYDSGSGRQFGSLTTNYFNNTGSAGGINITGSIGDIAVNFFIKGTHDSMLTVSSVLTSSYSTYAVTASYAKSSSISPVATTKAWCQFMGNINSSNVAFLSNGTGNCKIISSYNISNVVRQSTGLYDVYFSSPSPFSSSNSYMMNANGIQSNPSAGTLNVVEYWVDGTTTAASTAYIKTTGSIRIWSHDTDIGGRGYSDGIISLAFHGY